MMQTFAVFVLMLHLCAKSEANTQPEKRRMHNHGDLWAESHCWDHGSNHVMDPFCDLLIKNSKNDFRDLLANNVGPDQTPRMRRLIWAHAVRNGQKIPEDCSDAPSISNGDHSQNYNRTVGSTVNYVCNDGYSMHGPEVVTCERDNATNKPQWSKTPSCIKVTCPEIPDIENGYHDASNTTELGTSIRYYCNENYVLLENDTITCIVTDAEKNVNWSQPLPRCIETFCGLPPEIKNGQVLLPNPLYVATTAAPSTSLATDLTTTTTESQTTTAAAATTTGVATTTTADNSTSLSENSTEPVNDTSTQLPVVSENSTSATEVNTTSSQPDVNDDAMSDTVNVTTTTAPDTFNVTTTESASNDTTLVITTAAPDTFNVTTTELSANDTSPANTTTAPDTFNVTTTESSPNDTTPVLTTLLTTAEATTTTTASPPIPQYVPIANETSFQINDTITYQCNTGYGFVTSWDVHTVRNSMETMCVVVNKTVTWSSTVKCVPDCGPVPEVANTNHTEPLNTLQGSSSTYTCGTGFEMLGQSTITCLTTGNWSELPQCTGCLTPPEIEHGTHNSDYNTSLNSTVFYICDNGYSMIGQEMITCEPISQSPYAEWTNPPICHSACPAVPDVSNSGHTEPDNLLVGANVTYFCINDTVMSGAPDVVCQSNGNWSTLPECIPGCVSPPGIPNSLPRMYVANETDKVTISCEEHYILVGNDTLECIAGNWTTPFPHCECQFKPIDIVFIIDASGSLGLHGFAQTLGFVVDMVKRFPIETTNFGLLTFASDVHRQFYLNEYANDTAGLIDRIQNTTYSTGGTYTYSALSYARTQMFQEVNGMRPNVSHIAIVVTDGQSNDFNETVHQAELLKAAGVTIYSVGVGLTNQEELQLMASRPSYVFTVDNYDRIDQIAGPLAGITCSATQGVSDEGDDILE